MWEKGACVAIHSPTRVSKQRSPLVEKLLTSGRSPADLEKLRETLVEAARKNPTALVAAIGGAALVGLLSPELMRRILMPTWVPGGKKP